MLKKKISKDNLWVDWSFQIKDDELSENDLNDVRQYAHNKGVNIISVGYDHTLFKHKNNKMHSLANFTKLLSYLSLQKKNNFDQ